MEVGARVREEEAKNTGKYQLQRTFWLDRKLRFYHQYPGEVLKYFKEKTDMIRFEYQNILIIAGKITRKFDCSKLGFIAATRVNSVDLLN